MVASGETELANCDKRGEESLESFSIKYKDKFEKIYNDAKAMMEANKGSPPFAPPFLKAGKLVIGQTANILLYLGTRHGLAPKPEAANTALSS